MRITFEHPAVVTGTWENGHVRRDLVRVSDEFDIKEFTDADAPRSFTVVDSDNGTVRSEYRTVDGRQYKAWNPDRQENLFNPGSALMNAVYTGGGLDFPGITDILKAEIAKVRRESRYRNIENTERVPSKRELLQGMDARALACMKAPVLKKWKWLGLDTKAEVADWRKRTAAIFDNVILVEGQPYTLSFEPCYRLNASGTTTSNRSGKGRLMVSSLEVYSDHPAGPSIDPETGFENLGKEALLVGDQYFAANDLESLMQFAEESEWGLEDRKCDTIVVHDESAVTTDFIEMETVRHALIVHDRARLMVGHIRKIDDVEQYSGRPIDKTAMLQGMDALAQAIIDWQDTRTGSDRLSAPFDALLGEMIRWEQGNQKINSFDLLDQIKAFKVREDMADISIAPSPWRSPSL